MNSARFDAGWLEAAGFDELRVVHCRKVIRLLLTPKFLYLDCLGFPLLASFFCPLNEELLLWCPDLVFLLELFYRLRRGCSVWIPFNLCWGGCERFGKILSVAAWCPSRFSCFVEQYRFCGRDRPFCLLVVQVSFLQWQAIEPVSRIWTQGLPKNQSVCWWRSVEENC